MEGHALRAAMSEHNRGGFLANRSFGGNIPVQRPPLTRRDQRSIVSTGHPHLRPSTFGKEALYNAKQVYDNLLKLPQHAWELHREVASQANGCSPGPFWPKFNTGLPAGGSLLSLAGFHTARDAARQIVHEYRTKGHASDLVTAAGHLLRRVHDGSLKFLNGAG